MPPRPNPNGRGHERLVRVYLWGDCACVVDLVGREALTLVLRTQDEWRHVVDTGDTSPPRATEESVRVAQCQFFGLYCLEFVLPCGALMALETLQVGVLLPAGQDRRVFRIPEVPSV